MEVITPSPRPARHVFRLLIWMFKAWLQVRYDYHMSTCDCAATFVRGN